MTRARQRFGIVLSVLGVSSLLVELLRYWLKGHPIHAWPVVIGCLFGFVGFYLIDPGGAIGAGSFVEGFTVRVLSTIRRGRATAEVKVDVDPNRPHVTDDDSGVG
jgi:hypothetical protein